VSPPFSHDDEVSSVALATVGGVHLLATGSRDRTARLWHVPNGGSVGSPFPHPAAVASLTFGEIDGRTVLMTGCADGNVRLWDPLRAAVSDAVQGWFPSVAMDADIVAAGSNDGHVRLWDIASGDSYPPLPVDPGYQPSSESVSLPSVKVYLGGTHPRILLAQYRSSPLASRTAGPGRPGRRPVPTRRRSSPRRGGAQVRRQITRRHHLVCHGNA
jgi:WD40 repeat protein